MYIRSNSVFTPKKRKPIGRWILLALLLLLIACGVFTAIDNGRVIVRTQRVLVPNLPKDLESFTILHISDLNARQFGPEQKQLANALKNKRYNAVCLTGDMVGQSGNVQPLLELLSVLDPGKPVYFIAGDDDPSAIDQQASSPAVMTADWVTKTQLRGATFLGAPAQLAVGNATVWLSDAAQLSLDLENAAAAYAASSTALSAYNAEIIEQTALARADMKEDDLHIALSHRPLGDEIAEKMLGVTDDTGSSFARTVDLILAGSTVGGQWRLPVVGPVWSEGWFPSDSQVAGYRYTGYGALRQYITAGLGANAQNPLPGFRLLNTPEVVLITFTSVMDDDVLPQW